MRCNYQKAVPGDCHISCVRKFNVEDIKKNPEKYMEFAKVTRRLPAHAGNWPYVFNAGFVCYACPFKDEEFNKENVQELDPLGMLMAVLR
jgi:hypothetical protein